MENDKEANMENDKEANMENDEVITFDIEDGWCYEPEEITRINNLEEFVVPVLCYHEPDIQSYAGRIQGVVRNLRDAQYLYNRRKVIELDILESQINKGFLIPWKGGHLPGEDDDESDME